jgi:hypothetical protein
LREAGVVSDAAWVPWITNEASGPGAFAAGAEAGEAAVEDFDVETPAGQMVADEIAVGRALKLEEAGGEEAGGVGAVGGP